MPSLLPRARARYTVLAAGGPVGVEELAVDVGSALVAVRSTIEAGPPLPAETRLEWELDLDLNTRLLYISSRDRSGALNEVEAAVTGNGMLAHRRGPEGPSQIELGWGPDLEFNHLSAAFTEVIVARSRAHDDATRRVSAVTFSAEELEPVIVTQEYRLVGSDAEGRDYECLTVDSGRRDRLRVSTEGVLVDYAGLLHLELLELPTK